MADLVSVHRAPTTAFLGVLLHAWIEEEPIHDQLPAPVEEVDQARRVVGALEGVLLVHGHHRHAAALGGQRVTGAGVLLLLEQ